ncbi:hypothetical protein FF38_09958, partial [Lucilia cuprina]
MRRVFYSICLALMFNQILGIWALKDPVPVESRSSYLTSTEMELYRHSLEFIEEAACRKDLNATLRGLLNGQQWATSMFDASVRSPTGIESGILYHFGHYDQCLHTHNFKSHLGYRTNKETPVQAKYCLVDVKIEGLTTLQSGSREKQ